MSALPEVVALRGEERRPCAMSAKGFMCPFCFITTVKPTTQGKCSHCKNPEVTLHVYVNGKEMTRVEKPPPKKSLA